MHSCKLLFVFDNLEFSGTHRIALNLMEALSADGHDCRALVCMSDKTGLSEQHPRILWPNRQFGTSESLFTKLRKAFAAMRQSRILASEVDCLLAVCPPSALIASWASWRSGKPVIGWVHYDVAGRQREPVGATTSRLRDTLQNWLYYRLMPRLTYLVFVSQATAASMARQQHLSTPPETWQALPNLYQRAAFGSASTTLERVAAVKRMGQPIILVLGRLSRQKRWEDALAAALIFHRQGVAAQWIFVGDGPEQAAFLTAYEASPIKERLHWFGNDPNPLPVLAEADALVLTSLYEAWPTVIMEAFDLGVPVIAYDCPSGPDEMLGGNARGWTTKESPEALARALAERFSPPGAEQARQRSQAAQHFLDGFRPQPAILAWRAYLEKVMATHRAVPHRNRR